LSYYYVAQYGHGPHSQSINEALGIQKRTRKNNLVESNYFRITTTSCSVSTLEAILDNCNALDTTTADIITVVTGNYRQNFASNALIHRDCEGLQTNRSNDIVDS
jgi:hypothetical protein